ncbi:MAG: DUF6377 domain-containing protein, partial [Prevotellaceae bacterium]|nr:DUF6377 domain-containing protein [Prevotellaceae bacterium]
MKKFTVFTFFLLLPACFLFAKGELETLLLQLDREIAHKHFYEQQKEREIQDLRRLLHITPLQPLQEYDLNDKLGQKYRKYIIDSAIYYVQKNIKIAQAMNRPDLLVASSLHLSLLYSSAGIYVESKSILNDVNRTKLPQALLPLYFEICSDFYGYYAQSNDQTINRHLNIAYRDSLLAVLDTTSRPYKIHNAVKLLHSGSPETVEPYLLVLFNEVPEGSPDYAMISYLLGMVYGKQAKIELQRKYFALAAITDIQNATKDHAALQSLAMSYYESGEVERAYTYMKSAMDDIDFGKIRFR